jgi:hypothetical protein
MTLALVFAMSGGAFAAKRYLISSTKQIGPNVLKQLQGKAGKAGPAGPQGPQGPSGPAGAAGKDGVNGKDGAVGKDGVSVAGTEFSGAEGPCGVGGSKFTSASGTTYACNGNPAEYPQTLPTGRTETGVWGFANQGPQFSQVVANISYPMPLSQAIAEENVHFIPPEATSPPQCPGTVSEPKAAVGNLCIYTTALEGVETNGPYLEVLDPTGAGEYKLGAVKIFQINSSATASGFGSWAVTAP